VDAPGRLGRYELVARLASGEMGEIFLARLEGVAGFEKLFAVKRILPQFASDPRFRKMLIAEAQIASKLSHSNICQVYELGEADGQLFIAMEYLEGVTLLPLLRLRAKQRSHLELGFIANVTMQTCEALHYAHELDVIHRDVTLANVFVCENGSAKVLDFGIARVKDAQATQTDTVKGKYAYMAPEQLRGGELSRRVDVFALGVVLYEMLSLRQLFQRKTDYLTFHAVLEEPIPEIRRYRPDTPDGLVAALMKALDRDPANRFETTRQLRDAIADGLGDREVWSQEMCGELVKRLFSTEIEKRAAAVASAIERTSAGHRPFEEPPIAPAAPADEDDGFPSAEVVGEPMAAPRRPALAGQSRRWMLAVAIVLLLAIAVGATTFVVTRQPPVMTEIVVDKANSDTRASDMSAVLPHNRELLACAAKFPSGQPKATANLMIGIDGQIKSATFTPASLDTTQLGKCLVDVLHRVTFPKRNADSLLSLDLELPKRR
jgi:hypothetical protein